MAGSGGALSLERGSCVRPAGGCGPAGRAVCGASRVPSAAFLSRTRLLCSLPAPSAARLLQPPGPSARNQVSAHAGEKC